MVDLQITKYVSEERARGVLDADIKNALIEKGWKEGDVNTALAGISVNTYTTGSFSFMRLFEGRLDSKNYFFCISCRDFA